MKNYLLLLALASSAVLTSCGDDKDDDVKPKTKTELITAGSWKATALTISPAVDFNGDGTPDSDLFQFSQACEKDDITNFKTDKTYTEEEGATKCNSSDPQVYTNGTWAFSGDETKITLTPNGSSNPETFTISELSANTLKYTQTVTDSSSSTTYTITGTFSH